MSIVPPEVKEVNELLQKRIKQLKQVKTVLSLGGSDFDVVLDSFSKALTTFSGILNTADAAFVQAELFGIHSELIEPVPVEEIEGAHAIAAMHGKFKSLVGAVFNSDYLPDFFQDVIKDGTDIIASDSLSVIDKIKQMKELIINHATDLENYLDHIAAHPEDSVPDKIINQAAALKNNSTSMYLEVVKLFNNMSVTNDFSIQNAQRVMAYGQELLAILGNASGKNTSVSTKSLENMETLLQEAEFGLNDLKSYATNMQTIDAQTKAIGMAKMYEDSFRQILTRGREILDLTSGAVTAAKAGDSAKLTQAVTLIMKDVAYIQGQVGQFSKKNLKDIIQVGGSFAGELATLKNQLSNFVNNFPDEDFRILSNDIKTLLDVTKKLNLPVGLLPRGKRPSSSEVNTIKNRIDTKSDSIISHVGDLISSVTQITQSGNAMAATALGALKAIGKSPIAKLSLGDAIFFTKALDNPMYLTKIGACQEAITKAMRRNGIGAVELSMLSTLLDYVAGENEREMYSNFISDLDLQKSLAIKSVDNQIKTQLNPKKLLLDQYLAFFN